MGDRKYIREEEAEAEEEERDCFDYEDEDLPTLGSFGEAGEDDNTCNLLQNTAEA